MLSEVTMSDLRQQLTAIYAAHKVLTPTIVVTEATDPDHPLHNRFEWDDSVAGHKYRLVQAAELIRTVKVSFVSSENRRESVRAFVNVEAPEGNRYEPVEAVAQEPFSRELVLRTAEREWRALKRRYAHLAEFMDMIRSDVAV